MVKFKVHSNPQGQYYLPKEVREELGSTLNLMCNTKAAIIFNENTPLDQVLKSIELLAQDLKNRLAIPSEAKALA
jgi:DNA-binding transcriptional regulator/RsmH inhibitor MraZ